MTFEESYKEIADIVKFDIEKLNSRLNGLFFEDNIIFQELQNFLNSPSKRIRSVLTFLYLRANELEVSDEQIELQAIVELIHNASLIHDDVIDEDLKRRGQNTLNYNFGSRMAVISGDYLLSIVMKKLTNFNSIELFNIFAKTLDNMCSGEIQQYVLLGQIPSIEEYLDKSYLKTGALFEAGITAAMRIAGETKIIRAVEFGRNFGIAFQIRDDLKNVLATDSKDLANGIYNAPAIFSGSSEVNSSGIEKTKDLLNNYLDKAEDCLVDLAENEYKEALFELLELLKND